MSDENCFELYPPGTIGRLFIDVSIKALKTLDPYRAFIEFTDNYVCIKDCREVANRIRGIYEQTRIAGYNVFPTVPNDRKSLSRITTNRYDPTNPGSIIEYGLELLEMGGVNRLGTTDTAPAIMRIEFYEYPRPGYMGVIKQKLSKHPFKQTNLISLVLAVLGAYISYIGFTREDQSVTYLFLREFSSIQEYLLLKKAIARQSSIQQPKLTTPLLTMKIAMLLMKKGIHDDCAVGEMVRLTKGKNRLNLVSREIIATAGWVRVLRTLSKEDLSILEKLVDTVIETYSAKNRKESLEETIRSITELFYYLFQYAQCLEDAKYYALRLIKLIEDNIMDPKHREWYRVKEIILKATSQPEKFLQRLRKNIASTSSICEELVYA